MYQFFIQLLEKLAQKRTKQRRLIMLILTRRIGESLMIGDDVNVIVLGIRGHQVRLGINAPKEIPVHRHEIHERIQKEKANESNT